MEYQRVEHGEEIVLSYRPHRQAAEVQLRYEQKLPERMCAENKIAEEVKAPAREEKTACSVKEGKRGSKGTLVMVMLCAALAISCIGAGVWGIANSAMEWFSVVMVPDSAGNGGNDGGSAGNNDPSGNGGENGNETQVPEWDHGNDVTEDPTGEPQIGIYRPAEGTSGLELVGVRPGRAQLTAEEIYQKVAPATVTILGIHEETYSVGTGVIFSSDGYIVTNYHVIAGCLDCEVWVTSEYGVDSVFKAMLVGGDAKKDLAVLKIEAEGLPAAEFGVSSDLVVGDKVYAIGNPLGTELRSTFTDGIVSAVDRNVDVDGVTMTLIQTNTALNHGNSGGPLINAYGQVIGINTIKMMSGYDTIEGLGFAIPSSLAQRWINDIIALGEVRPSPVLGLSVNRIPVKLEDGTVGLEVLEVTRGLGAYRAGVQLGDIVVAFNGAPVTRVDDIYAQRVTLSVGDRVIIRVFRDGEYLDLKMVMMAEPE